MDNFQKRIFYQGDLKQFFQKVCNDFNIGIYQSHEIIPIGYEDFNLLLKTSIGTFFVKIFASFRDEKESNRYVNIINKTLEAGVSAPKLFKSKQGFLYAITFEKTDRLIVMEYIDGKTFYERNTVPVTEEIKFIIKQAALINSVHIKPSFVYDHWAITSLLREYDQKKDFLKKSDRDLIEPLVDTLNTISLNDLPHCFVHGDITKTNTMKSLKEDIYILDFAVANWYPRIQELAVLLCDLFFDPQKTENFLKMYDFVLLEYQKFILLTKMEIQLLPTFVKLAHAMHVLLANYEKETQGNTSVENEYFLDIGRKGLQFTNKIWS